MALSKEERDLYRKREELLDSLLYENSQLYTENIVKESSSGKITDLAELQKILEGKNLFQLKLGSFNSGVPRYETTDVIMSIMFLSNKNKKVDSKNNLLSLAFSLDKSWSGEISALNVYEGDRSANITDFMELPEGIGEDAENTASDFVKMCDTDEIYNLYKDNVLDIIRSSMPTAHQMFTGPNLIKQAYRNYHGMSVTLFVTYDARIGKFMYCYNPDFILESAIDEYIMFKNKYKSLASCYTYLLAFYITHEMMHIITNNTSSNGNITGLEKVDHTIENIVMDSFINCNLSILFKNADGIKAENGLAPFPYTAYKSKVSLRGEHNKGFKRYKNTKEFAEVLANLYMNVISENLPIKHHEDEDRDLTVFEGADIVFHLDVSPRAQAIRKSSMAYQKFVNDVVKTVTDGGVYMANSQISTKEKIGDQDVLPNGTLVRIKHSSTICIITGYDDSGDIGIYTLNNTDSTVNRKDNGDGTFTCSYVYTDSGDEYGKLNRSGFVLFNQDSYENVWVEGQVKQEKKKLDDEEIQKANSTPNNIIDIYIRDLGEDLLVAELNALLNLQGKSSSEIPSIIADVYPGCEGLSVDDCKIKIGESLYNEILKSYKKYKAILDGMGDLGDKSNTDNTDSDDSGTGSNTGSQQQKKPPKSFNVGDIVFVRTVGKFGRIVSMNNGRFEIEEMEEQEVRVLDDSRFVR